MAHVTVYGPSSRFDEFARQIYDIVRARGYVGRSSMWANQVDLLRQLIKLAEELAEALQEPAVVENLKNLAFIAFEANLAGGDDIFRFLEVVKEFGKAARTLFDSPLWEIFYGMGEVGEDFYVPAVEKDFISILDEGDLRVSRPPNVKVPDDVKEWLGSVTVDVSFLHELMDILIPVLVMVAILYVTGSDPHRMAFKKAVNDIERGVR